MTENRYRIPSTSALRAFEAAAAGKGIALDWRGLVDRHIESGVLIEIGPAYVELERAIHAALTDYGRGKPLARRCLECLARV